MAEKKQQMPEGAEAPKKVIAFQPDALEIANKPLPGIIRFGVWFPLIAVIGAIVWASLAKTDVVVQGGGKIVTDLSTIIMKPLDRVVIKSIDVKIGDIVTNDQVLIQFDPEINEAEKKRLQNEITSLEAQLARLNAEYDSTPFTCRDEEYSKVQQKIYDQRLKYFASKMTYFERTLAQIGANKKSNSDRIANEKIVLSKQRDIEKRYVELPEGRVPVIDLLRVQMESLKVKEMIDQLENDNLELDQRHGSLKAEKAAFEEEWKNKIAEEKVTVDRSLKSMREQLKKQIQLLEYVCLRSPCNAVVQQIAEFAPGSGVREAEALITLIPLDGVKELEAEIRPEDIGHVKVGAEARIKLTAYPFQKYGTLDGKVRTISEDTFERSVGGATLKYYRARLTVSGKLRPIVNDRRMKDFRLIPGMETQCEIKCDRRRVIEYVLYPLIKAFDEAAREP